MKTRLHTLGAAVITGSLMLVAPIAMTGCQNNTRMANENLSLSVTSSADTVNAGEIVTFMVQDKGTLGKDIDIKWSSTGGDLDTEKGDRVARVQFDEAGTYTVTAKFWVDGNEYQTERKTVKVRPLPR